MYELSISTQFSAAHHLAGYEGVCANPHGHNWEVEVFVRGNKLDEIGMLLDFGDLKTAVVEVLDALDHTDLNELPAFAERNPTSEYIAKHLFEALSARLNRDGCSIHRVAVKESPTSTVSYRA